MEINSRQFDPRFPIAYFARFAFNLLLEPQVNPIKHFPVVTVSHKVLFTTIPYIRDALGVSEATVVGIIWCIPGIFGFLAWEFKENWRLYRATRPKTLQPLAIGHHGESIRGYLRPGFHSGTVPKLFRKMRIAERKSERSGQQADRHRFEHEKHHIAEAVARLVDRQMLSLLRTTAAWKEKPLSVKHVDVTCQTLHVGIDANGQRLDLTFSIEANEIRLIVSPREGVNGTDEQRETWNTALQGLAAYAATPEVVAWDQWEKKW